MIYQTVKIRHLTKLNFTIIVPLLKEIEIVIKLDFSTLKDDITPN